jgi:hypothetical protein
MRKEGEGGRMAFSYKVRTPPGNEVVNGESAPYLGRDYRIHVTETDSGHVELGRQFLVPPAQPNAAKS